MESQKESTSSISTISAVIEEQEIELREPVLPASAPESKARIPLWKLLLPVVGLVFYSPRICFAAGEVCGNSSFLDLSMLSSIKESDS